MKNSLVIVFCLIAFVCNGYAQESGICFEQTREWKQIVKKAKKEKKFIFIDCYTDWCGPCRAMADNVFPQEKVGQFFNRHFVNAKFEMEKDADGILLKKKYHVEAFPTMLFIDPATGEELYRLLGIRTADALVDHAVIALDPRQNIRGMAARYAVGERTPELLRKYQETLSDAGLPGGREIALEYLNVLDAEQLADKYNWHLLVHYISDPLSKPLQLVLENRERFYAQIGKEEVDFKLREAMENAVEELTLWQLGDTVFDEVRNVALIKYFRKLDDPIAPAMLASLYAASAVRQGDFQSLLVNIQDVLKYNFFRKAEGKKYFDTYLAAFQQCRDEAIIKVLLRLIDEKCGLTTTFYGKSDLMKRKAVLQEQIGDADGAAASRKQVEEFRRQGDDAGEWMQ